jgi:SagB-type dehydrogenase family enzyme
MKIKLQPVYFEGGDLRSLLENRRSVRDFQDKFISLSRVSAILWAACGKKLDAVTRATRTIPSAGATYPLELYLVTGDKAVKELKAGLYHYIIDEHALELIFEGDVRAELSKACLSQDFVRQAPISLIIAADFRRTTGRYGKKGENYVYMEVGHACQNANLAVTDLNLGTVEVGAFSDFQVSQVLQLDKNHKPLIVMPIGYAK